MQAHPAQLREGRAQDARAPRAKPARQGPRARRRRRHALVERNRRVPEERYRIATAARPADQAQVRSSSRPQLLRRALPAATCLLHAARALAAFRDRGALVGLRAVAELERRAAGREGVSPVRCRADFTWPRSWRSPRAGGYRCATTPWLVAWRTRMRARPSHERTYPPLAGEVVAGATATRPVGRRAEPAGLSSARCVGSIVAVLERVGTSVRADARYAPRPAPSPLHTATTSAVVVTGVAQRVREHRIHVITGSRDRITWHDKPEAGVHRVEDGFVRAMFTETPTATIVHAEVRRSVELGRVHR